MSEPLLEKKWQRTSFGNIAYLETGGRDKPPLLFVHGIPTSGYLWRHVLRFLQNDFHCYAPDLMGLGDTEVEPTATFHMDAQAEMLVELMAALGHDKFALIGHDQGGAAVQIICARLPDKVTCLVLTDCVCYDNWPVPVVKRLQRLARLPLVSELLSRSGLLERVETSTPWSSFRRGVYDPNKLSQETIQEYLRPLGASPQRRLCFREFLLAGASRYTELAVAGLKKFTQPTLVVWAADDKYLSPSWGRKLFEDIPGATQFEIVGFCGHFWPEERPAEFASIMGAFLAAHLGVAAAARPAPDAGKPKCATNGKNKLPVVEKGS